MEPIPPKKEKINFKIIFFHCVISKGAVTIKRAKMYVEQLPKLNKNCNLVRYIFVVPL
jgi:hypothetical protein